MENEMEVRFSGVSRNESFARVCAAAFAAQLDPTLEQVADIKTAVSEAVTNAIVHAYPKGGGEVVMRARTDGKSVSIEIEDTGVGIEDVARARTPFYTRSPGDERSGMGFTVMEAFTDSLEVYSEPGKGTRVVMTKIIRP